MEKINVFSVKEKNLFEQDSFNLTNLVFFILPAMIRRMSRFNGDESSATGGADFAARY